MPLPPIRPMLTGKGGRRQTRRCPEFLAEAGKRKLEINPVSGADIDKLIADIYSTPKEVVAEARAATEGAK